MQRTGLARCLDSKGKSMIFGEMIEPLFIFIVVCIWLYVVRHPRIYSLGVTLCVCILTSVKPKGNQVCMVLSAWFYSVYFYLTSCVNVCHCISLLWEYDWVTNYICVFHELFNIIIVVLLQNRFCSKLKNLIVKVVMFTWYLNCT